MPSFKQSLSETQMWQISLMLANADKLPNSVTAVLAGQPDSAAAEVAVKNSRRRPSVVSRARRFFVLIRRVNDFFSF